MTKQRRATIRRRKRQAWAIWLARQLGPPQLRAVIGRFSFSQLPARIKMVIMENFGREPYQPWTLLPPNRRPIRRRGETERQYLRRVEGAIAPLVIARGA
jgi:hypothetical protein